MSNQQTDLRRVGAAPVVGRLRRNVPTRAITRHALAQGALIFVTLLFLAPFVFMVLTSLKTGEETTADPPTFFPANPLAGNYRTVWQHEKIDFPLYLRNTVVIALLSVAGAVTSCSLVAYGFAKIRFKGRGVLFVLMLSTMMIPFPVTMVALFSIYHWIGEHLGIPLLGTNRPLWIGAWFGSAFNIFLLRQFFVTIPDELIEAARIDGCSEFGIFTRIMLPLARPALTVVALFTFLGAWNDFLGPLLYLQRPQQYTLALGLQAFQSQTGTQWHLLMAASTMIILPAIALYLLAQRTFTQGIATSGIKG